MNKYKKMIFAFVLCACLGISLYQFMLVGSEGSNTVFADFADKCFENGDVVLCDKNGETVADDELTYFYDLYNNQAYNDMKEFLLDNGYSFGN